MRFNRRMRNRLHCLLARCGILLILLIVVPARILSAESLFSTQDLYNAAEVTESDVEASFVYKAFKQLKYFAEIRFTSHSKLNGLEEEEFTDFLKLKVKSTLSDLPFKQPTPEEIASPDFISKQWGVLNVQLVTVGTNFPVAYTVTVSVRDLGSGVLSWNSSKLGYASEETLGSTRLIKDAISDLVEHVAIQFVKGREADEKLKAAFNRLLQESSEEKDAKQESAPKPN